ncbi:MAG TPA: alkaline phosphatase [Propionicimonas sp.]|nr:alkaline phosphatase [Propionicimonas sp.]
MNPPHIPCLTLGLALVAVSLPAFAQTGLAAPREAPARVMPVAVTGQLKAPKNVIVMIGDGMGFNQLDAAGLYRYGTSAAQVAVNANTGAIVRAPGTQVPELAAADVKLAVRTTQFGASYDPAKAWSSFGYVLKNPTDSAAAATAMATGVKTDNGAIGVDPNNESVQNLTELAVATGRSAGVVTSVPISHATPAGFTAHESSRSSYRAIARDQLRSKLSVVMGAGNPWYTDNGKVRSTAKYTYLYKSDYQKLRDRRSGFTYVASKASFDKLTKGAAPKRVFGLARVASTLQQKRSGTTSRTGAKRNAVPSLATMAKGALNVLDADRDGLFLMIEGGAIDWANHANQKGRLVEEGSDFLKAIAAVNAWVETKSSWDETLLIVTADHESGYLAGAGADPNWTMLTGRAGSVPAMSWHTGGHTSQLVPFYARGSAASAFTAAVIGQDPVRGAYLDNTSIQQVVAGLW